MKCRLIISWAACLLLLPALTTVLTAAEKLDRGLIALEREDGSVFLSWRLLQSDPEDITFLVTRRSPDGKITVLSEGKGYRLTNIIDKTVQKGAGGNRYLYQVAAFGQKNGAAISARPSEAAIVLTGRAKPYIGIPLKGDYDFQKVGIGDLDGDGAYEFVIKQPDFNTNPYQQPGYWKKSTTTYKLEAYRLDGTMLWRYDMGWSIEAGIWYSPWVVYDVDGDGKAEVYCKAGVGDPRDEKGLVQTGPEFLVKIDGQTGQVVARDRLVKPGRI